MRIRVTLISAISAFTLLLSYFFVYPLTASAAEVAPAASLIAEGRKIAFHRKKGNCLACHAIEGGRLPGNIGPPLVKMKERYPDKEQLKAQIWDATKNNPNTIMPPFGRHLILSEDEINKIVEFLYSL